MLSPNRFGSGRNGGRTGEQTRSNDSPRERNVGQGSDRFGSFGKQHNAMPRTAAGERPMPTAGASDDEDAHAKQLFEQLVQQEMKRMKRQLVPASPNAASVDYRPISPRNDWRDDASASSPIAAFDRYGTSGDRISPRGMLNRSGGTEREKFNFPGESDGTDWTENTEFNISKAADAADGTGRQNVMAQANKHYLSGDDYGSNGGSGSRSGVSGGVGSELISEGENVGFGRGLKTLNSEEAEKAQQEKYNRVTTFRRDLDEQRQQKLQQQLSDKERDARERQERLRVTHGSGGGTSSQPHTNDFMHSAPEPLKSRGAWGAVNGRRSPERDYLSPTHQTGGRGGATIGGAFPIGMEPVEAREQQRQKQQQYALELERQMNDVRLRKEQEKAKEQEWEERQTMRTQQQRQELQQDASREQAKTAAPQQAARDIDTSSIHAGADTDSVVFGREESNREQQQLHQTNSNAFQSSASTPVSQKATYNYDQGLGTGGRRGSGMMHQNNVGQSVVNPGGPEEEQMIKKMQRAKLNMDLQQQIQEKKDRVAMERKRLEDIERSEEERVARDLNELRAQEQASNDAFFMEHEPGLMTDGTGEEGRITSPTPTDMNRIRSVRSHDRLLSPRSPQHLVLGEGAGGMQDVPLVGSIGQQQQRESPISPGALNSSRSPIIHGGINSMNIGSPVRATATDQYGYEHPAGSPSCGVVNGHGYGHVNAGVDEMGEESEDVIRSHQMELLHMHEERRRLNLQMETQRQQIQELTLQHQHQTQTQTQQTLQQQQHSAQEYSWEEQRDAMGTHQQQQYPQHQNNHNNHANNGAIPPNPPHPNHSTFNNNNVGCDNNNNDDDDDKANDSIFEQSLHSHSKFIAGDSSPVNMWGDIQQDESDSHINTASSHGDMSNSGGIARMSTRELEGNDEDDPALPVACEYLVYVGNAEEGGSNVEIANRGHVHAILDGSENDALQAGVDMHVHQQYSPHDDDTFDHPYNNTQDILQHQAKFGGGGGHTKHIYERQKNSALQVSSSRANSLTAASTTAPPPPLESPEFNPGTGSGRLSIDYHDSELDQSRAQTAQAALMALQRASTHSDDEDSPRWGRRLNTPGSPSDASGYGEADGETQRGSQLKSQEARLHKNASNNRASATDVNDYDNFAVPDDNGEESYEEDFHDDDDEEEDDEEDESDRSEQDINAVGDEWTGVREVAGSGNGGGGWREDKSYWEGGRVGGGETERERQSDGDALRRSVASSVMTSSKHSLFPVHTSRNSRVSSKEGQKATSSNARKKEERKTKHKERQTDAMKGLTDILMSQEPNQQRLQRCWSQSGALSVGELNSLEGHSQEGHDSQSSQHGQGHVGEEQRHFGDSGNNDSDSDNVVLYESRDDYESVDGDL